MKQLHSNPVISVLGVFIGGFRNEIGFAFSAKNDAFIGDSFLNKSIANASRQGFAAKKVFFFFSLKRYKDPHAHGITIQIRPLSVNLFDQRIRFRGKGIGGKVSQAEVGNQIDRIPFSCGETHIGSNR